MIINCPSCGVSHKTDDYPNAFEINCVCGYSILVPSEGVLAPETQSKATIQNTSPSGFTSGGPSSMDAEDEALIIKPEGLVALDRVDEKVQSGTQGVLDMTPPDQLPSGMIYDSFELPSQLASTPTQQLPQAISGEEIDLGNQDAFSEETLTLTKSHAGLEKGLPSQDLKLDGGPGVKEVPASKAEALVNRVQLSSMGQFIGATYRVRPLRLQAEDLEKIVVRVQRILGDRPWLDAECKKRGVDIHVLRQSGKLENLPEIIALEVYLACFELGGSCLFELQQ